MPRRKKKKHRQQGDVELNLAAMLDMAFQLLAFFVLTFQPAPIEGYITLRMPPPQPTTKQGASSSANSSVDVGAALDSLMVTVTAGADGDIGSIRIEESAPVPNLTDFEKTMTGMLSVPGATVEQVVLQVGGTLKYENLVRLLDVCSHIKLADGKTLDKLSIVELPNSAP
ncbi:MAG TPA: biopolymer transporter ExbD [Pirellulales bacterium]|jgi:biopolymer transport protein ExbD